MLVKQRNGKHSWALHLHKSFLNGDGYGHLFNSFMSYYQMVVHSTFLGSIANDIRGSHFDRCLVSLHSDKSSFHCHQTFRDIYTIYSGVFWCFLTKESVLLSATFQIQQKRKWEDEQQRHRAIHFYRLLFNISQQWPARIVPIMAVCTAKCAVITSEVREWKDECVCVCVCAITCMCTCVKAPRICNQETQRVSLCGH